MAQQQAPDAGHGVSPAFELEAYDDETLKSNQRLEDLQDIEGHVIAKVFMHCSERDDSGEVVLVTENGCWIVIAPHVDDFNEGYADIRVIRQQHHRRHRLGRDERLSDFIAPDEVFDAGLCSAGERDALNAERRARQAREREARAAQLKAELAQLERTASGDSDRRAA